MYPISIWLQCTPTKKGMIFYLRIKENKKQVCWTLGQIAFIFHEFWRLSWCNDYHHSKWTWRHKFKSRTRHLHFTLCWYPWERYESNYSLPLLSWSITSQVFICAKQFSNLSLSLIKLSLVWHKARCMRYPVRIKLTCNGLLP